MANRLSNQTSPYLLQHADNPVDWYPWGEEALQKAVTEDKPIFLSIGYSSCHWCHVMAHESFEDEDVAKVLNQFFIPVKVDREERPDIDSLYMSSVVAMTGQGGWPMSVFLKPTGEPFFAGTYFPPERRYGMPGLKEVLFHIRHIWRVNRNEIEKVAENTIRHLEMVNRFTNSEENSFSLETLQSASARLVENFDYQLQGWGPAPLFPHPLTLEFLLSQYTRARSDGIMAVISGNLKAMARGGMWDLIGGGFHRYSTDDRWHIPHFEKMLTDNAQLALVYLHAFLVNGDGEFKNVTERTLDFILRELMSPEGGFYSSLDADSEGEEGLYYTWTDLEIQDALSNQADWELVQQVFDLEPAGSIVFRRKMNDQEAAQFFNLSIQDFEYRLRVVMRKLLTARFMRIRPATDDKIIASWNSLAGQAFVQGARFLNRPDYLLAAQKSAEFLRAKMIKDGRVFRSYRDGQTSPQHGFLEDYAASILFLLDLYQLDHNQEWFSLAKELAGTMISLFADEAGGFFDTQADDAPLVVRPRSVQDNAVPSGGALAAHALLLLAEMDGIAEWRMMAEDALSGVYELAVAHPLAFSAWLQAADLAVGPFFQVSVVWPEQATFPAGMEANIRAHYHPRLVSAFSPLPLKKGAPALLSDRLPINGQATAFVCQGFTCLQPTTDAGEMARQLKVD